MDTMAHKDIQQLVDDRVDVALDTVIQGTIAQIPVAGNYILAALTNAQMSKLSGRIALLALELRQLGANKISKEFINSDEGYDLLMNVCQQASRTRSEDKIKRFARIVRGVLNGEDVDFAQADRFIDIVAETNDEEMLCLGLMYSRYEMKGFWINDPEHISFLESKGIVRERQRYIVKRLESKGLLIVETEIAAGGFLHEFTEVVAEFFDFMKKQ